ncbi:MAG: hypothetical protein ACFFDB_08755 [Promethearchaeota archaeon]
MKKSRIFGLSFVSLLLLFSLTNISNAAPPAYVGIKTGDSFNWVGTADMANVNSSAISLIGADNWTLTYNMLNEMIENETGLQIGSLLAGAARVNVKNITDEMPFYPFTGVGVYAEILVSYEPGLWMNLTDGSYPSMVILNPAGLNASNYHYLMEASLFLPKGIDFSQLATWINANVSSIDPGILPLYNNLTVSALADGLKVTVLGDFFEWLLVNMSAPFPIPTIGDVELQVKWNENGVFSFAQLTYGGLALVTAQLIPGSGEIPGFVMPIFLGASAIALVGAISIIRRKKRII